MGALLFLLLRGLALVDRSLVSRMRVSAKHRWGVVKIGKFEFVVSIQVYFRVLNVCLVFASAHRVTNALARRVLILMRRALK